MSLAAAAIIVGAGVTAYAATSAGENADRAHKDATAGRLTASQIAQLQHDDLNRQLNEQIGEFKAHALLSSIKEKDSTDFRNKVLVVGAGAVGFWLITRKK